MCGLGKEDIGQASGQHHMEDRSQRWSSLGTALYDLNCSSGGERALFDCRQALTMMEARLRRDAAHT